MLWRMGPLSSGFCYLISMKDIYQVVAIYFSLVISQITTLFNTIYKSKSIQIVRNVQITYLIKEFYQIYPINPLRLFLKMSADSLKLNYENYLLEIQFKSEFTSSITATDLYEGVRYQNKNVEFSKIKKSTIIGVLKDKNISEVKCNVSVYAGKIKEVFMQKGEMSFKEERKQKQSERCLKIEFTVSMDFIQGFSEHAILYEMDSHKKFQGLYAKKLPAQVCKQIKREVQQIQKILPELSDPSQMLQVHEVGNMTLDIDRNREDREIIFMIGFTVVMIIMWIAYFEFLVALGIQLVVVGSVLVRWWNTKFLVKEFTLKKGNYKVEISGSMTVSNYAMNSYESFTFYLSTSQWRSKKINVTTFNNYSYGYPFNGVFFINVNEAQKTVQLQIKRNNFRVCNRFMNNVIITAEKLPGLVKIQ